MASTVDDTHNYDHFYANLVSVSGAGLELYVRPFLVEKLSDTALMNISTPISTTYFF